MRYLIVIFLLSSLNAQTVFNSDLIIALSNYHHQPLHLITQCPSNENVQKMRGYFNAQPSKGKILYFSENLVRCVVYDTSLLMQLVREKIISRAEIYVPKKFKPLNDTMVIRNRILPVKQGVFPLSHGYNGMGVLLGLIDSGIDFSHPDFKDSAGLTRIIKIWDQSVTGTVVPMPYAYGQEWDSTSINNGSCTHSDLTYWGHGTHVAGVASGNGRSTGNHQGCAPKSTIMAVAVDFNSNAPVIADAVHYIINTASALNMPVAINASVGDYYGSHDATDLQAQMIISLVSNHPGRIMCAAAGNAGNIKYHVKVNMNNTIDTMFTWLQNNASNIEEHWIYADTNQIKNVQYSIGCTNPAYQYLGNIGFKNYNYALGTVKYDTLKFNNQRIGTVMTSASINTFGVYECYFKINADSSNYLWSIESKGTGSFDAWNFDFLSTGLPSPSQYPRIIYYVMPDTVSSMVSGFQCSSDIITVANYVNLKQYYDYNWALQTTLETAGQLANSSSAGPTRTGLLKPDIAASGNSIFSCVAMGLRNSFIANYPNYLAPGGYHVMGGGTSAASPVVTGLALLYLQAFPNATNMQFKNAVTSCAYSDIFTGNSLPNNKWGYGKLDGLGTFTCSVNTDIQNMSASNDAFLLYPNPADNNVTIQSNHIKQIIIKDIAGKTIYDKKCFNDEIYVNIDLSGIQTGVYLVEVQMVNQGLKTEKLIIYHP